MPMPHLFLYTGIILLAAIGFSISIYIRSKKKSGNPMICPLGSDCRSVIESEYSYFWGIQLELLGMAYYLAIAFVYALILAYPHLAFPELTFAILALSALAFLFSAYLASVQAFALGQWCTWCLASAGISTLIFAAALTSSGSALVPLLIAHEHVLFVLFSFAAAIGLGASSLGDVFLLKSLRDLRISEEEARTLSTVGEVAHSALALLVLSGGAFWIAHGGVTPVTSLVVMQIIAVGILMVVAFSLYIVVTPRFIKISFAKSHLHAPGELHILRKIALALAAASVVSWYALFFVTIIDIETLAIVPITSVFLLLVALAIAVSQLYEYMMGTEH